MIARLPLLPAEPPEVTAEPNGPQAPAFDGLRVLAAEDNPMNQLVLRTLLEASGIEVTMVSNGQEALDAWSDDRWDIVLMDIQMPVMDGVTATRNIRAAEHERGAAGTPIIALTANAMDHHMAEYLNAGIDAVVAKPIDLATLLGSIAAVLDNAAMRGARAPELRLGRAGRVEEAEPMEDVGSVFV